MYTVGVREFGGPEQLEIIHLDDPRPPVADEVVVRVRAAAVNPTDTLVVAGSLRWYRESPRPLVPGMDVAGVLEAVGTGVDDLQVGDRVVGVLAPNGTHGGYAQRVTLPRASIAPAPRGSSHEEAATLPMNGLTASLVLDLLELPRDAALAVTGAAGTLGGYVIELARLRGLQVVADAGPDDVDHVRLRGADIIVPRGADVSTAIRHAISGGVAGLVDGSAQGAALFPAVRDGGGFVTVRGSRTAPPRGIELHRAWVTSCIRDQDRLAALVKHVEAGDLTLRVAGTFEPEDAAEAHRRLARGGVRGRLVLRFPDRPKSGLPCSS